MVRPIQSPRGLDEVVVVGGLRTPFAKIATHYRTHSALDLGAACVQSLLEQTELAPKEVDAIVYGQVVPSIAGPNVAREILLALDWPRSIDAFSVTRACATSTQATATAAMMIQTGQASIAVVGGTDSASDVPITVSKALSEALVAANQSKAPMDKVKAFTGLNPKDFLPVPPAIRELSTGLTMGEAAEKMAKENGIDRAAQDAFAHRSHTRAAAAWAEGIFREEVTTVRLPPSFEAIAEDNLVRKNSELSGYERLKPAFDRRWGTITAGNSSPLTDGASATLLMRKDVAKALGYTPLAQIRAFAFAALDPSEQLLMGPAYAIPRALDAAGMHLSDIDLVDIHEAFAAQVLSNLQALGSQSFAEEKLGRSTAVGEIDDARLNIHGGSIALGHPFAATGTRQINTMARALQRRGEGTALVAQCAAGGLGAAIILEAQS